MGQNFPSEHSQRVYNFDRNTINEFETHFLHGFHDLGQTLFKCLDSASTLSPAPLTKHHRLFLSMDFFLHVSEHDFSEIFNVIENSNSGDGKREDSGLGKSKNSV